MTDDRTCAVRGDVDKTQEPGDMIQVASEATMSRTSAVLC